MTQIIGVIGFYIVLTLILTLIIILINKHERDVRRMQCMMNHPAGKRYVTERSHSGQTKEIFHSYLYGSKTNFDQPILFNEHRATDLLPDGEH